MTHSKRPRGAQPGNHNALKHARYASIALPAASARPEATARPRAAGTPGLAMSTPVALFERQMLDLLDNPGRNPADLSARLHELTVQLIAVIRVVKKFSRSGPYKPERKLP